MATVYELQKLRCHLCGQVFTAEPPAARSVTFSPRRPDTSQLVTAEEVNSARSEPGTAIVDVRRCTEFTGEEARA